MKGSDLRIYKDVLLITPGVWTDAMTKSPVVYTEKALKEGHLKWKSNYLNVDHSFKTTDRIGYIVNPYYGKKGVMADLHIYPITQTARDTISLIDAGLVNWLSVEILTVDRFDTQEFKRFAEEIEFLGAAVVTSPACKEARIK